MKKKKLFSLVLATVLTAATVLPCYGASTKEKISNAQAEQAAAQSQLDSIQSRIDELNSKKGQSEEYLSELNQQLDDLQNRLQELQDQYDAKQNELVQIQADLEDAKAKEEEQYEAMKLRIQYMYENSSGNGYMAMLFSSKSISELISRAEYIQKISDFDRDLMQEYEDTVDQVKEKETQVQEEQAAIVELQQQSSDQQEAIQELYAAAYQELRTYSAELDDAKSSESALVDEINSKADAINDLIRQAKEEEIAAQKKAEEEKAAQPPKEVGFLAVSVGDGLSELFKSLGVDYIIEGGQTMNPSTADILDAVDKVNAKTIFVLPNNKNIILAANQAAELMTDKELLVIPTKTIPQGITAVINFVPELSVEENEETMLREIKNVKTGQVTYAVRDTVIDDKEIKKDDFMGIGDQGIVAVGTDMVKVTRDMIAELVDEDSELISIYYGCDVAEDAAEALRADLEEAYPACDIELQYGGQPIYYYTVSVE